MAFPVFPRLRHGWPVTMRPSWATIVGQAVSGREVRLPQQVYPLWEFELVVEILKDEGPNWTPYQPYAGVQEIQAIAGFYNVNAGQYTPWYFEYLFDNSRQGQVIATADGKTHTFTAVRTLGLGDLSLSEPVGGIKVLDTLYLDGAPLSPASYSYQGNQIKFTAAPAAGVLTADFSFYYLCRFIDDKQDFSLFAFNLGEIKSLKFRSVKGE